MKIMEGEDVNAGDYFIQKNENGNIAARWDVQIKINPDFSSSYTSNPDRPVDIMW